MKTKRMVSLIISLLIICMLSGCNAQNTADISSPDEDILFSVNEWKEEFNTAVKDLAITGKTYYISNNGDDNNDGLSPETAWATLDRAFETYWPLTRTLLKPGDAVLLERGGTWYVSPDEIDGLTSDAYNIVDGVTLGAYGEGARPIIRGDIPEANDPSFWTLYYDKNGTKIWATSEKLQDVNVIVFNEGESYANEIMPFWSTTLNDYCNAKGEMFDIVTELENNLSFCCMLDLDSAESVDLQNSTAKGTVFLRCDEGNPADVFYEVAVPQAQTGLGLHTNASLVDLDIRYFTCIAAELSGYDGYTGQQVINCEVSWCGGLISEYQFSNESPEGVLRPYCAGGALQVSGSENSVRDCYIHHCGPMTLICSIHVDEPRMCKFENMTHTGNLIEYCGSALHMADLSKMDYEDAEGYISNLTFSDNIVMYSGEGWVENHILQIDSENSMFFSAVENTMGAANNGGIYIADNIFYGSKANLLCLTDNLWNDTGNVNQSIDFSGNVYAQYKNGTLCNFNWERGWRAGYASDEQKFLDFIRDETGVVIVLK
ncbi:MAG: hypothetical protein IKA10_05875 [Oscillospiraceae bacterium]|nr:hypothetical protein [Oscillospiraceae bacterium]